MDRASFAAIFATLLLAACSHSASLPSPALESRLPDSAPQVWERGTPPVQWELIPSPKSGLWDNNAYALISPYADREDRIWLPAWSGGDDGICEALFIYNMSGSIVSKIEPEQSCDASGAPAIQVIADTSGHVWFNWNRLTEYSQSGTLIGDYSERLVNAIAAGLSGDMWYTTSQGGYGYVVRIRNGALHFFRMPSSSDSPGQIAVAADGTAWFTLGIGSESTPNLAKLNPLTSQVTVLPFHPIVKSLYAGPDGNIWYTTNPNTLERVASPSGVVTRFPLPHSGIGQIANAPDKTMWLDYSDSKTAYGVMNVSSNGTVLSSIPCPTVTCNASTGDSMDGITYGPDGNIWTSFTAVTTFCGDVNCQLDPYEGLAVYVRLAISASPASVAFGAVGQTATIKVSESRYSGSWTASSTAPSVVTVVKWLTPNELEIKAVGKGAGRIIIHDADQNYYGDAVMVN